jgi:hypothetical protein
MIMNFKTEIFDEMDDFHLSRSCEIAMWSKKEVGLMVPITSNDICNHEFGVLALTEGGLPKTAGYIAIKDIEYNKNHGQIGAFIVNSTFRGLDVGASLLSFLLESQQQSLPDLELLYAYVNSRSLPIFLNAGGVAKLRNSHFQTNCKYRVEFELKN